MKNMLYCVKINVLLAIIMLSFNVFGQCPPDDFPNNYVHLMTQEDVDNFIIDYPNCTELNVLFIGDIIPSDITNLNGLINLENIGAFQLNNVHVTNLQGLNNLNSAGSFMIVALPNLLSLEGLDSLTEVEIQFYIENCDLLPNLNGLESLTSISEGSYFFIYNNINLNDISGLDCYFFSEEFRNGAGTYQIQSSLYPSIFQNCGIVLSDEAFTYSDIRIYPNPVETTIHIDSNQQIEEVKIFDMFGRLVKHKISDFESFDLSDLVSGGYIMRLQLASNRILNHKLVVR